MGAIRSSYGVASMRHTPWDLCYGARSREAGIASHEGTYGGYLRRVPTEGIYLEALGVCDPYTPPCGVFPVVYIQGIHGAITALHALSAPCILPGYQGYIAYGMPYGIPWLSSM